MGRILLYLSTHWVRFRVSLSDKKLRSQNKDHLAEIATLKSQLVEKIAELETEQVKILILQKEVDGLTKVIERDRKRVAAEIRDFGLVDKNEETNVS